MERNSWRGCRRKGGEVWDRSVEGGTAGGNSEGTATGQQSADLLGQGWAIPSCWALLGHIPVLREPRLRVWGLNRKDFVLGS